MFQRKGEDWVAVPGQWGTAGDPAAFSALVRELFQAELASTDVPSDCCSGTFGGEKYDHIEARCHVSAVDRSIVQTVFDKHGRADARLAIVAGLHCFTEEAIELAAELAVHLFCVWRGESRYEAVRVP